MAKLPLATPSLARKIWESMPNPSTRRVATKLRQAGGAISHATVARWRSKGWRPSEREQQHPLEGARASLNDAVPLLTGNPTSTIDDLIGGRPGRDELGQLTDAQLLRRAARELAMAVVMVAHLLMRQAALVLTRPGEVGILFWALAACAQGITAAFAQATNMQTTSTDSR